MNLVGLVVCVHLCTCVLTCIPLKPREAVGTEGTAHMWGVLSDGGLT